MRRGLTAALVAMLAYAGTADAACLIERATFRDRDGIATLDFRPTGPGAAVTNTFRLVVGSNVSLEGMVLWSDDIERPNGRISYKCPDGDVTGQEFEACTLWQGVVYTVDGAGAVGLLPKEGAPAPVSLILSDLGLSMKLAPAWSSLGLENPPFDVFSMSGCQE